MRNVGDDNDIFDHRPYTRDNKRTPVGLSTDSFHLILYPERGVVNWKELLPGKQLEIGYLCSGVVVYVIELDEPTWEKLRETKHITLQEINELINTC